MKYRKKPVVIDAIQWRSKEMLLKEVIDFFGGLGSVGEGSSGVGSISRKGHTVQIATLEGVMTASDGDWIIKGVNGELYPCKPDIFAKTYEPAVTEIPGALLSFGSALEALKEGKRVCRAGWNGKGMWLALVKHEDMIQYPVAPIVGLRHPAYDYDMSPWIGMKTADDKFVPWLASQTDMLASDWMIVE